MVILIMSVQLSVLNLETKKASTWEAFWRCFPFLLSRASLLGSGAKVKKEAENSSIHACVTLSCHIVKPY